MVAIYTKIQIQHIKEVVIKQFNFKLIFVSQKVNCLIYIYYIQTIYCDFTARYASIGLITHFIV